jgi:hypothetical protein
VNTEPLPGASTSWVRCNPYLGILKDGRERGAAAVREGIRAALTIVRDEPSDRHGLHRPCGYADRSMVDAGLGAEIPAVSSPLSKIRSQQ